MISVARKCLTASQVKLPGWGDVWGTPLKCYHLLCAKRPLYPNVPRLRRQIALAHREDNRLVVAVRARQPVAQGEL